MNKKLIPIILAIVIVVGGGGFFGGMKYIESKFQRGLPQGVNGGFRQRVDSKEGAQSLSGEVISQSEDSFTIKLNDGSTKIVFVNDSTNITKSVDGALGDIKEGKQVFVSGNQNPDGSVTAQAIQLRPQIPNQ